MIQMMTMTVQAVGLARNSEAVRVAPLGRIGAALRRAAGFAITASGFAVIAAHLLSRVAGA